VPPAVLSVAEPAPPAAPDLSPVEEPRALLLVARWKSPVKGVDQALSLLGVPLSLGALLAVGGDEIAKLVSVDASFDFAMSLDPSSTDDDPKVLAAVSIPLASFELAGAWAEREGTVTPIHPGVLRLARKAGEKDACDLTVAAGDAPARLVCGAGERDLEALRGWLARGLPRTSPDTSDLVATFRAKPLKDRYLTPLKAQVVKLGDEARTGLAAQGVIDPDLLAAPTIALDEGLKLLDDLDRIDFRTSFFTGAPPALVAGGSAHFGAQSSWLTRALTDGNDRAGPPPPMFWRAPRDAYAASWGRGGDAHLYDGLRNVLHKALGEVLTRAPLEPADKEAIAAFVDATPRAPSSWVSARGSIHQAGHTAGAVTAKPAAIRAARTPAESVADARALATEAIGWTIEGIEAPAPEYVAWAKRGLALYERAASLIRTLAGARNVADAKVHEMLAFVPRITTVTALPGWPKGTVAFDVIVAYDSELVSLLLPSKGSAARPPDDVHPKKTPPAKGSLTIRLAIVPDGERTWIGFSADLDALKKRMNAVMPGAPADGTLAAREGLEVLRRAGQTGGGFFSAGEILEGVVEAVEKEKPEHGKEARELLASLPNKGQTPILLVGSGAGGQAPSSAMEVRLQQGTLADLAALGVYLASSRGKDLLKKLDDASN
jgi:hypothetical protein